MDANRTGRSAEDVIADLLIRQECEFDRQVDVGLSIYGQTIRADFFIYNISEYARGVVIESKWQDTKGTADQKFPFLVANIRAGGYRYPVIVVAVGGGCSAGAIQWLKDQVDGDHLVAVFSFEELLSWLQRRVHVQVTAPRFDWTKRTSP